jgi:carbamoylphosphate synthase large subunit
MVTILAMSSYFKGEELLREAKRQGARVLLLIEEAVRNEAWPWESIDELYTMPSLSRLPDVIFAVAYLMRGQKVDRIIPLDEYDVEMAALLREHLRIPGNEISMTKRFRDKLIMRQAAQEAGIRVPDFTPVINYDDLRAYMDRVPAPWVLKPRLEAGAMGIRRIHDSEQLWRTLDELGDQQSFRVLERFVPGNVYHVDSLTYQGETIFTSAQKYGAPPLNVSHDGGIFSTFTLPPDSEEVQELKAMNRQVIQGLGLENGASHAEFIRGHEDGQLYFLEIAARVGGANIGDLVAAATGVNLWAEWGRMEICIAEGKPYTLPPTRQLFGGLLISLARQEYPDLSGYGDEEIVWRMNKKQHAGLIVATEDEARMHELLDSYKERFVGDFMAVAPPKQTASH